MGTGVMEVVSGDDMAEVPILGRVAAGQPILASSKPPTRCGSIAC